jgi:hypothetical protein
MKLIVILAELICRDSSWPHVHCAIHRTTTNRLSGAHKKYLSPMQALTTQGAGGARAR